MSDPVLATQIITVGTATVSVIGSDGAGKSKILTAAEIRAAAELSAGVTAARVLSYSLIGN
jgi:hypothetical protein